MVNIPQSTVLILYYLFSSKHNRHKNCARWSYTSAIISTNVFTILTLKYWHIWKNNQLVYNSITVSPWPLLASTRIEYHNSCKSSWKILYKVNETKDSSPQMRWEFGLDGDYTTIPGRRITISGKLSDPVKVCSLLCYYRWMQKHSLPNKFSSNFIYFFYFLLGKIWSPLHVEPLETDEETSRCR